MFSPLAYKGKVLLSIMKKTNVRTSKVININNVLFVVSGDIIKRQGVNDAGFEFNYIFSL